MPRYLSVLLLISLLAACASPHSTHQNRTAVPTRLAAGSLTPTLSATALLTSTPAPSSTPSGSPTAVPTATLRPSTTPPADATLPPTHTPSPTATPTVTPWPSDQYLQGPLVAYLAHDFEQAKFYVLLQDLGSQRLRRLEVPWTRWAMPIIWHQDGCQLLLDDKFYDLRGNLLSQLPSFPPDRYGIDAETGTRSHAISTDGRWLIEKLLYGAPFPYGWEFEDYGVISLTNPNHAVRLTTHGIGGTIEWSPDGAWIAYVELDAAGTPQVYRIRPDGSQRQRLTSYPPTIHRIIELRWSPSSSKLAVAVENRNDFQLPYRFDPADLGRVDIVDLNSFSSRRVPELEFWYVTQLWWSADESTLFFWPTNLPGVGELYTGAYSVNLQELSVSAVMDAEEQPTIQDGSWIPVGDTDRILSADPENFWRVAQRARHSRAMEKGLGEMEMHPHGHFYAIAPPSFPGEVNCQDEQA